MGLRIYNTLTRQKDEFVPVQPGKVSMYVCGMTVYDMCHIGHARSMIFFDVVFRYLMSLGYEVSYVRNFTDVDDKIINRANELAQDWQSLAEKFIGEFYLDMDSLGVLRPTCEPKATEHIDQIQALITELIQGGYAYQVGADVVFSVDSFRGYGKLSGKKIDDLIAGARVDVDEKKRNPLDFVLWKGAKPGEPSWDSPWGLGRPGWHIECSAMSMHYLGKSFDIHGGGADLEFPHHENEIAQSESATGQTFVAYWIHNGFVNIRSEKMSKSLGNVLNIRDILSHVHPEALRLFLLSSHYRSPLDYTETSIREASSGLERLYHAMQNLDSLIEMDGSGPSFPPELSGISDRFREAIDDDFNTPRCLAVLFEAARSINRIFNECGKTPQAAPSRVSLSEAREDILRNAADILGLLKEEPKEFLDTIRKAPATDMGISESEISSLLLERAQARKQRDFGLADKIRNELAARGILLEDGPQGTTWKVDDSKK